MEITILSGSDFEREYRKQLAAWKKQVEEENKQKVEAVASYMAAEIKRVEK
jgi:hypothetical protein